MSPLLFMIYLSDVERELEMSEKDILLSYLEGEKLIEQILPGLIYADDLLICDDSRCELQRLPETCSSEGGTLVLQIPKYRLEIMAFTDITREHIRVLSIDLENKHKLRKLGIWIKMGRHYAEELERN